MGRNQEFDYNEALDNAMHLFWNQGYEKTSVQELTECMGIKRGSIYNTFGDKYNLFLSAITRYQTTQSPDILHHLEKVKSIKELLGQMLFSILDDSVAKKGCLIVNTMVEMSPHDEQLRGIVTENMTVMQKLIVKAIQKGKETGEFRQDLDENAMALFVVNNLVGLKALAKSNLDKASLGSIIHTLLSQLA